jgi:hypothetical protein
MTGDGQLRSRRSMSIMCATQIYVCDLPVWLSPVVIVQPLTLPPMPTARSPVTCAVTVAVTPAERPSSHILVNSSRSAGSSFNSFSNCQASEFRALSFPGLLATSCTASFAAGAAL